MVSDNEQGMTHLMSQHLGYLIHHTMVYAVDPKKQYFLFYFLFYYIIL